MSVNDAVASMFHAVSRSVRDFRLLYSTPIFRLNLWTSISCGGDLCRRSSRLESISWFKRLEACELRCVGRTRRRIGKIDSAKGCRSFTRILMTKHFRNLVSFHFSVLSNGTLLRYVKYLPTYLSSNFWSKSTKCVLKL